MDFEWQWLTSQGCIFGTKAMKGDLSFVLQFISVLRGASEHQSRVSKRAERKKAARNNG